MSSQLEKKLFKRFRNLTQYSSLTDKQIEDLVKTKIDDMANPDIQDDNLNVSEMFYDKAEKKEAKRLLHKYLSDFSIENISDKNTLSQLIFLEVFNKRLQEVLNRIEKEKDVPSIKLIDSLHKNLSQIVLLKGSLGLTNKNSGKTDSFNALETLKKKFKVWREGNQASRSLVCPNCGKMILLKIRVDEWEAQNHPFFKDRILGNTALINLYKRGAIGKKDVADVLESSPDYIDWLIERWNKVPEDKTKEVIKIVIPDNGKIENDSSN
jgi:DNA-directed RNA polymerase subunit RPC12/RpoP